MYRTNRLQSAARFFACILGTLLSSALVGHGQNPSNPPRPAAPSIPQNSVNVVEHLTPEEAEDWELNTQYQPVAQLLRENRCAKNVVQRYESEIIPAIEKAQFDKPKKKFLFLANRDLGNCYLEQNRFQEAEASFQKILEYAPVWPGTDDSAYAINFRQIATAQIGQQHWSEAEQSLLKSIETFDMQISAWEKKDGEFAFNYRGAQSISYALLSVVYFREDRVQEALKTVEKAYDEVTTHKLDSVYRNQVLTVGKGIASASGDPAAQKLWSQRNP
jgi:tetratricopeptide (TPR) repeat protein